VLCVSQESVVRDIVLADMADDLDSANRNEAATDADRSIPRRDGANAETGDRKYSRNTTDTNCISCPLIVREQ
jgi:hypothetical protein